MPMSLRNMTVGKKLLLGFMSIALLVAIMGYFGVRGTEQISKSFDDAANSSVPAIRALARTSPLGAEPSRTAFKTAGFRATKPLAVALLKVSSLSEISTMRALPFLSRWVSLEMISLLFIQVQLVCRLQEVFQERMAVL